MAGKAFAPKWIGGIRQQDAEQLDGCSFLRPMAGVFSQLVGESCVVHGIHAGLLLVLLNGVALSRAMTSGACAMQA